MKIMLVVDDEPMTRKALVRLLTPLFDKVFSAATVAEAERVLDNHRVTHLLCDRHLDVHQRGEFFIARWRAACPSLLFAGLITGDEVKTGELPAGIDQVFRKPFDVGLLRSLFGG